MRKFLTLVTLSLLLTACGGKRGDTGPQGPAGPQGPQGQQGDSELTSEVVWVSDGVGCGGEHSLPSLLPEYYFTTEGGHTKMRNVLDDSEIESWATSSNSVIHTTQLELKSSNSVYGLEVRIVTLTVMRASGCGFVHATQQLVEGL